MGLLLAAALVAPPASTDVVREVERHLAGMYPALEAVYKDLHANPELAFQEERTSASLAGRLKELGYEVATGIGGTGVVGVLRNGEGPTVMLRTDMDALPIAEATGLPYASKARGRGARADAPVMHACGHDVHMTAWLGTAELMTRLRPRWRGTLVLVAQPAEEIVAGAAAMLPDGLYSRYPKPEYALAVHVDAMAAGTVNYHAGYFRAAMDAVDITVFGRPGHGAAPQNTVDPILIASRTVVALHTIVSREIDPQEPALITVGSIHGGTQNNIVPEEVKLELTVRSYAPEVRRKLLQAIERVARGEALAGGAPREPKVEIKPGTDAVLNDPEMTERVVGALRRALGPPQVVPMRSKMTSEDFSQYRREGARTLLLHVGAQPRAAVEAGSARQVHTPTFAVEPEPTITTAVKVEAFALLELLRPR